MLHPQLPRDTCTGLDVSNPVEQGKLNSGELQGLRSAYSDAQRVGLRARACVLGENREIMLSNAGPRVLALTGAAFSAVAPDNEACWTSEARALHSAVERVFKRSERRAN